MSSPGEDGAEPLATARETGESLHERIQDTLLTGVAITIPLVVTLYVLTVALDFVSSALNPFIEVLRYFDVIQAFESVEVITFLIEIGIYGFVIDFFTELVALLILFGIVALIGIVGHHEYGERIIDSFDIIIASIPGIGTVYDSFRRMGDVVLDEGQENFQDIKLVECFEEEVYVLGFKTSEAPGTIETSTGHDDMVAMFLPLAPNPVTGGMLTYVPASNVHDIDMTVEEGVRSILTSGVATGKGAEEQQNRTMRDLAEVANFQQLQDAISPEARDGSGRDGSDGSDGQGQGTTDQTREGN